MKKTVKIDEALHQRAKAQAALEGANIESFVEDALRLRLKYTRLALERKEQK